MTAKERDEALGLLIIVSIGVVIYTGIDRDWAWYVTVLATTAVFFVWAKVLFMIDKFSVKPVVANPRTIERLRQRQQRLRHHTRAV